MEAAATGLVTLNMASRRQFLHEPIFDGSTPVLVAILVAIAVLLSR